jgi:hypothetical protein
MYHAINFAILYRTLLKYKKYFDLFEFLGAAAWIGRAKRVKVVPHD